MAEPLMSPASRVGAACLLLLSAALFLAEDPWGGRVLAAQRGVARSTSAPDTGPNAPVVLNMLWRVTRRTPGGVDYMTTSDPTERDRIGGPGNAAVVAYVPAAPVAGTAPLYRLLSSNGLNHMDSPRPTEGGYAREGALGFPWTSPAVRATLPGLTQLVRPLRGWDHAPANASDMLSTDAGTEAVPLYGYRRYGRSDTVFATLSAGGVTIRSNLVAGCSLWSWQWHGVEFVNVHDLGRQIQTDVGFEYQGTGVLPTEAGSTYSGPGFGPATTQSAPCASATTVDSSSPSPTQRTRAVPLEWKPTTLGGGPSHPVAWPRMLLGKDVTLNYAGLGPVARYTTVVDVPAVPAGMTGVEIPSVYLTGDLRELTLYDAAADTSSRLTTACGVVYGKNPASGYGGVIAASDDGRRAFGLYGVNVEHGGSVTRFAAGFGYARYYCDAPQHGPYDNATTKLRALSHERWAAGENRFTTYLVCGTKADVLRLMRRLYELGAK